MRRDTLHLYSIDPFRNYIRKNNPGGATIKINVSLTCMTMIKPTAGSFEIVKLPAFDLYEVTGSNGEFMDKSYARVSHFSIKNGYADTCVNENSCLIINLGLNNTSLLL